MIHGPPPDPTIELRRVIYETFMQAGPEAVDYLRSKIDTPGPSPSSPGEPPHLQTARLWRSIHYLVDGGPSEEVSLVVFSDDVQYAPKLEWGTHWMEPRPFFGPTLEEYAPILQDKCEQAIFDNFGNR